jgi:hypothetical protein
MHGILRCQLRVADAVLEVAAPGVDLGAKKRGGSNAVP